MRLRNFIFAMSLLTTSQANAEAQFLDGNALLQFCQSQNTTLQNRCVGYIMGIVDSVSIFNSSPLAPPGACVPGGVSATQVRDVVVSYLIRNPKTRHQTAAVETYSALSETWRRC